MAIDPEYPDRPYVYVAYTHDSDIDGEGPIWGNTDQRDDPCPSEPGATQNRCVVYGRLSRITVDL